MNYQESCSTYQCNPSLLLTCSTIQINGCGCSSGQSLCDCISTHYWNGYACVPNYSCYSSVGVPCNSGSCTCGSNLNKYWVGSICCTFIPYGTGLDAFLASGDDETFTASLGFNFPFFGKYFSTAYININGYLSFTYGNNVGFYIGSATKGVSNYMIGAFVYDLYTSLGGYVSYRQVTDNSMLTQIQAEINRLRDPSFNIQNAFVISWDSVRAFNNVPGTISFQILLSTDGVKSYCTINYGILNFQADQSFYEYVNSGGAVQLVSFIGSGSTTNVGVSGRWIISM